MNTTEPQLHDTRSLRAPNMGKTRRAGFYSVCYSCGWVGQTRSTLERTLRDAHEHRQQEIDAEFKRLK